MIRNRASNHFVDFPWHVTRKNIAVSEVKNKASEARKGIFAMVSGYIFKMPLNREWFPVSMINTATNKMTGTCEALKIFRTEFLVMRLGFNGISGRFTFLLFAEQ